jgi:uncharacterized protein
MLFEITAQNTKNETRTFLYDNQKNMLSDENGMIFEYTEQPQQTQIMSPVVPFDKYTPLKKSKDVFILKIQLGLSCNYTCDYCSQKFVERAPETNKKDIDAYLAKLDNFNFDETRGLKVEFWGGEPFVYWKTLKPLAEAIKEKFSHWKREPRFSVITNGSILTKEMCAWLYYMGFEVAISHDGPGQSVRGPDPFDDPAQKKIILDFYKIMRRQNRISFNSMLNSKNQSRKAIHDWFIELTGDPTVPLGEGSMVDAYDEDGITNSLDSLEDHFKFRQTTFDEIRFSDGNIGFGIITQKIDDFTKGVLGHQSAEYLNQKCGMDIPGVIATDLRGNVMTCQNVSPVETSKNGESHFGGTIDDIENIALKSATHWMNRPHCKDCPVLQICQGSCMFLDGKYWETSCANAYSDAVVKFALSIEKITGFIPVLIKGEGLPLERQDVFGTMLKHTEKSKKKVIPIKVVAEKVSVIDDVEVYGKSRVEV